MKPRPSNFIEGLETYIEENFVSRPNPIFLEMEAFAKEKSVPIVSAASGKVLSELARFIRPQQIWELGTAIGYSTLWLYEGWPEAEIISLDRNGEQSSLLDFYFSKMYPNRQIPIRRVTAWVLDYMYENISQWENADLFFVDCDKVTYPELWDLLSAKSKPGARILFDNVLWHGRVAVKEFSKPSDLAVRSLWEKVKSSGMNYTLYPVGDGLLLIEKP
ncbi:O-methyltransferase [Leptospira idonii]|uniref:O-methyltransferase n=1 Tax=Leptospira idonii TaxID=1193500 RepID=A0A4R9M2B5_9LEPT|nr:O-methyltransferase [Leptospira idonii]TGN20111.1 O-methyltransferase [Leptospira idonii]